MFKVKIPLRKFLITDHPHMRPDIEGNAIPYWWGTKTKVSPALINTTTLKYKLADEEIHPMSSVEAVRCDGKTLTSVEDYAVDLAECYVRVYGMPFLAAATTYYMRLEGDWAVSAVDYVKVAGDSGGGYANGQAYFIDAAAAWNAQAGIDLCFRIYGKENLEDAEELQLEHSFSNYDTDYGLRDQAARSKIAQSFLTGATGFYATRIVLWVGKEGAPVGSFRVLFYEDTGTTSIGGKCKTTQAASMQADVTFNSQQWNEYSEKSEIEVDATGYTDGGTIELASSVLKDILVTVLEKPIGDLKVASTGLDDSFDELEASRTDELAILLDKETTFESVLAKIESGGLFKMVKNLDNKIIVPYYVAGEPAGTPHVRDEEILSFKCLRETSGVFYKVEINYNENPITQEYVMVTEVSADAKNLYSQNNTMVVETYLKSAANARTLAISYLSLFSGPQKKITFSTSGWGFNLYPTQKVKVTRNRADSITGSLSGVLFRILKLQKRMSSGTVTITAVLDSQSY